MKLQGCWAVVGHGVEAKAAGVHDGKGVKLLEGSLRCWTC